MVEGLAGGGGVGRWGEGGDVTSAACVAYQLSKFRFAEICAILFRPLPVNSDSRNHPVC